MSGILERIEAKLDQLLSGTANTLAAQQPQAQPQTFAQPQQAQQAGMGVLGAPAAAQPPQTGYPPATQEMIVQLVTPLVNDPNTKAALQAEMHAMGVSALPEAQPHQYPELYARFQRVAQQAQQAQVQQQPAAPASII